MTNEDGDERRRRQEEAHIIYYLSSKFNIDLFFIAKEQSKLQEMRKEVEVTNLKNNELRLQLEEIEKNPAVLERVARERYFMKRPEEEVFRIVE